MNFSRRQAESLVKVFLNEGFEVEGDELIILREKTIEKSYGWVFFYSSKQYEETGVLEFMMIGNGPIVFERDTGTIERLDTAFSAQEAIAKYERRQAE
jgi:hypothetical protein